LSAEYLVLSAVNVDHQGKFSLLRLLSSEERIRQFFERLL
jgi:hypothetical protein